MERDDKDYPRMSHARIIEHALDDGTVLTVVVTGLKSEPRTIARYKGELVTCCEAPEGGKSVRQW